MKVGSYPGSHSLAEKHSQELICLCSFLFFLSNSHSNVYRLVVCVHLESDVKQSCNTGK